MAEEQRIINEEVIKTVVTRYEDIQGKEFDHKEEAEESTINIVGESILDFRSVDWNNEESTDHIEDMFQWMKDNPHIVKYAMELSTDTTKPQKAG